MRDKVIDMSKAQQPSLSLLLVDIRSAHNVGSIFRTADAFGVAKIFLTGITPCPKYKGDRRLPHVAAKAEAMIAKTALGAEKTVAFEYVEDTQKMIAKLTTTGQKIYALEQSANSIPIAEFKPKYPCVLVFGNEVEGLSKPLLQQCDDVVEIPMHGNKESLNVSVAAGIALFAFSQ